MVICPMGWVQVAKAKADVLRFSSMGHGHKEEEGDHGRARVKTHADEAGTEKVRDDEAKDCT